jgi:hypothetical protein
MGGARNPAWNHQITTKPRPAYCGTEFNGIHPSLQHYQVGLYMGGDTPQGRRPPAQSPIGELFGAIMEGHNPLAGDPPAAETPGMIGLTPSTKAACSEVLGWNLPGGRGGRGFDIADMLDGAGRPKFSPGPKLDRVKFNMPA